MVHMREKGTNNQLVQPVSPYDELLPSKPGNGEVSSVNTGCCGGLGEVDFRDEEIGETAKSIHAESREEVQRLSKAHSGVWGHEGVPFVVAFQDWDAGSEISLESSFEEEARTLTPHPSFDGPGITAQDFHYLFQASKKLDEQDWPSDEDCDPPATTKAISMLILQDVDERLNKRSTMTCGEI